MADRKTVTMLLNSKNAFGEGYSCNHTCHQLIHSGKRVFFFFFLLGTPNSKSGRLALLFSCFQLPTVAHSCLFCLPQELTLSEVNERKEHLSVRPVFCQVDHSAIHLLYPHFSRSWRSNLVQIKSNRSSLCQLGQQGPFHLSKN